MLPLLGGVFFFLLNFYEIFLYKYIHYTQLKLEDITWRSKEWLEHIYYHEKIKFIFTSHIVIFFLLYRQGVSTNFIANCCSSAAGISWSSLFSYSLARNYFNNFKSYEGFFFSVTFSCLLDKLPNFVWTLFYGGFISQFLNALRFSKCNYYK